MYTVERLDNIYIIQPIGTPQRRPHRNKRSWPKRPVIAIVVLAAIMFLVTGIAVTPAEVSGMSMEPSLHNQESILVDKWTYLLHPIARGDVIVFEAPKAAGLPGQVFVKRVIGIPGDVVSIYNAIPIVDGVPLQEPYVLPQNVGATVNDKPVNNLRVPPDEYFVLGDNRRGSFDSRAWGLVPRSNILGRAVLVYWPLLQNNNGLLPDVSFVYDKLHQLAEP